MSGFHTVEKIGGTSMTRFADVMKNVIIGNRSGEELYNRIFVVSAYGGITNLLLENKKTGEPGIYGFFAKDSAEWRAALEKTREEMLRLNRTFEGVGLDVAEADEWNERRPVEWNLMAFEENEGISRLICDLNRIYREQPELYAVDDAPEKFEWINSIAADTCCLSYARKGLKEDEMLLVVANFSGVAREVATGVPAAGKYKEILNTDDVKYGGSGVVNSRAKRSRAVECDERDNSLVVRLAPLSLSILKFFPVALEDTAKQAGGRTRKRG